MKMLPLLFASMLAVCSTTTAHAFLGATIGECEVAYGKSQDERMEKGRKANGFLIADGVLKNTLVFVMFNSEGRAQEVCYMGRTERLFTEEQIQAMFQLNGGGTKKPFVHVGHSPDKSKRIWSREDSSAHASVEVGIPRVTFMTQDGLLDVFKAQQKGAGK